MLQGGKDLSIDFSLYIYYIYWSSGSLLKLIVATSDSSNRETANFS